MINKYVLMNYLIKELRHHYRRSVASITGYFIASMFKLLVLATHENRVERFADKVFLIENG
jgi:hypothetical protein